MFLDGTGEPPFDTQLREHLVADHGWTALDLLAHGVTVFALHRFEHFEESAGLVALTHDHGRPGR
jgi:hypothetical protein